METFLLCIVSPYVKTCIDISNCKFTHKTSIVSNWDFTNKTFIARSNREFMHKTCVRRSNCKFIHKTCIGRSNCELPDRKTAGIKCRQRPTNYTKTGRLGAMIFLLLFLTAIDCKLNLKFISFVAHCKHL